MGSGYSCWPKVLVALLVLTQLFVNGMSGAAIDLSGDPLFANVVPHHNSPPIVPFRGAVMVPPGPVHNSGGHFRLYSRCSRSHMQIRPRNVNAHTSTSTVYTDLIFHVEDDGSGTNKIRIQGGKSKLFLCFNKRGKLIARNGARALKFEQESDRCQFIEHHTNTGYTELQSVANELWYVGFRKNGKPMRGYTAQQEQKRKCFRLIKTSAGTSPATWSDDRQRHVNNGQMWSLPQSSQLLTDRRRHRHHPT